MRTKTPFRRKRLISRGSSSSTSVEVKVERELQCSRCKAIFPDYLARCPECGSEEWIGLVEVNPYTRMPMETFLTNWLTNSQQGRIVEKENYYNNEDPGMQIVAPLINDVLAGA